MVRDINPGRANSDPGGFVAFRGDLYFSANDGTHGFELWKTDGTPDGTTLAAEFNPGPQSSDIRSLTAIGERLYFVGRSSRDASKPFAVYTTDGTLTGTEFVRDFASEVTSSVCPGSCLGWPPGTFVAFGGLTYFIASDGISGLELWQTDGTPSGTSLVKDICPGRCSALGFSGNGSRNPPLLQVVNGRLIFFANDGVHGTELWTSDGREAGTHLVKDIFPGSTASPYDDAMTSARSAVFFSADDGVHGLELWRSDGTETGTFLVADLDPGSGSSAPNQITLVGDTVFFVATDGSGARRLWKTDSAGSSPVLVSDAVSDPAALRNLGGTLYFTALAPAGFALWKTYGSPTGTSVVRVLKQGNSSSSPHALAEIDGTLVFFATSGKDFSGLWRSDGTGPGTQPIAPVTLGGGGLSPTGGNSALFQGSLFFSGNDGVHGPALWRTDGTVEGTRLVTDISNPCGMTIVGDALYFGAFGGVHGNALWKTDGTEAGTVFLKGISLNCDSGGAAGLVPLNGLLYFSGAAPPAFEPGLWRTDGTSEGTALVKRLSVQNLTALGGEILFFGSNTPEGSGLWKSDGTEAGTSLVKQLGGFLTPFVRVGDVLLFFASSPSDNRLQLWRSDGTAAGTTLLADFPFGLYGNGSGLVPAGDRVFFAGEDDAHGIELWMSDGTPAGTHIVKDIAPGAADAHPRNLAAIDGVLLFAARDPAHGEELWRSDGTEDGTFLLQDIAEGPAFSLPGNFTKAGSLVYFTADDGETGVELWGMPISAFDSSPRQRPHKVQGVPWRR
jgi:ELWxxDGT repeat protein